MWERRELCLPALVVSQSLKPPEGVEVPCQGLVWVSSGSTGAQPLPPLPTSWAWPRSVNDVRAVCWHPEMWLLLFQRNPGFHLWLEPSRSVQPGRGGRENTARGSCVGFVLSSGSSSHSMGSAVILLLSQTLWACGWERKRGKCLCQWWTALVRLLCLAWRMLAVYLLYQVYLVAKGVQIDTNLWIGS